MHRLVDALSPDVYQHADQAVDWQPWASRVLDHSRVLVLRDDAGDSTLPPVLAAVAGASQPQAVVCCGIWCSAPRSDGGQIAAGFGTGAAA